MNFRNRVLAYAGAGAAGLLAAGAFAAPAFAADEADLAATLNGTTLAATTSGKAGSLTVTNKATTGVASGVVFTFDLSELDTTKVDFFPLGPWSCPTEGTKVTCESSDIKAGENYDLPFALIRIGDAAGDLGKLSVTVSHAGADADEANNTATAAVTVGGSGADLSVWAPDVPLTEEFSAGTVAPGEETPLFYAVANYGDEGVAGVKLTIQLPEHVTFVEEEPDCEYSDDNRTAVCTYADLPIIPGDEDTDEDGPYSAYGFVNLIKVADDAPAPAVLGDGLVTAEGIVVEGAPEITARNAAPVTLPEGVTGMAAKDVDESDNSDEFAVHTAATSGGGGGGGDLPVTGVQAGLIGGVGLAALAGGGALFMLARRRKVVLVTPGDETPTA